MSNRASYKPGPAAGAEVQKHGEKWTLVLVRELKHPPSQVWQALTDAKELKEWAPFDSDHNLDTVGPVTLTTVGAPQTVVDETRVSRAVAPRLLEYHWGGNDLRWQLEPTSLGTRLTLWHNIPKSFISMGAAGWHICLDVMDALLAGDPLGRIVAGDAMNFDWQRLHGEYAKQFGVEPIAWLPKR